MQHRPSRLNNHIEHSNKCAINEHLYARLTTVGGVVCAQFECLINLQAIELCVFFFVCFGPSGTRRGGRRRRMQSKSSMSRRVVGISFSAWPDPLDLIRNRRQTLRLEIRSELKMLNSHFNVLSAIDGCEWGSTSSIRRKKKPKASQMIWKLNRRMQDVVIPLLLLLVHVACHYSRTSSSWSFFICNSNRALLCTKLLNTCR